jgi:hypothetical protein
MKKGVLFVIIFLLFVSIVNAGSGVSITEIDSKTILQPNEIGTYTLEIKNLDSGTYKLQIKGDGYAGLPTSDIEYVFAEPNILTLQGKQSAQVEIQILLKPHAERQKRYKTYVDIISLLSTDVKERVELQVFAMEPKDPITMYETDSSKKVAPGQNFYLELGLANNLDRDLSNVDIYISSDIFEDQQTVSLFEGQERTVEFLFPIDNSVSPGDYTYNARVYFDGNLEETVAGTFSIQENLDITAYSKTETDFLFSKTTIVKQNNGNSEVSESYSYSPGLIESWFSKYNIEPTNSNEITGWTFNIEPGEEFTINITVDYRPVLIALIVLILISIVSYFVFIKRVTMKKEVFKLKYSEDGLADFKVLLHVKNMTSKSIKDITVIDILPKIIKPTMDFGTLHPKGVERGQKGVRIMWKIDQLVSGEERIISYKVKPSMSVLGNLDLPAAVAKFKNINNRVNKIKSNRKGVNSTSSQESKAEKQAKKNL